MIFSNVSSVELPQCLITLGQEVAEDDAVAGHQDGGGLDAGTELRLQDVQWG